VTTRLTGASIGQLAIASASIAAEVSITHTTSATGDTCMTLGPFGCDGGTYLLVVDSPYLTKGTTNLDVELWVDGVFNQSLSGHMAASTVVPGAPMLALVTLSSGSHTLVVKAFVDGGTGKFGANNGATGNPPNAIAFLLPLA